MFFVTFEPLWIKAVPPTGKYSVFVFFGKTSIMFLFWGETSKMCLFFLYFWFWKNIFRENETIFEKYFELVNKSELRFLGYNF